LRAKVKSASVMVRVKCLAIFLAVEHGANGLADRRPGERPALAAHPRLDRLQWLFGGIEQFATFARALCG